MICDGLIHCPFTEADEAHYVCSPWHLKLIAIGMILTTYAVAVGVTIYLICVKADQLEAERIPQQVPTQREKSQLQSAFDLTRTYLKNPVLTNEEKMRKHLKKLSLTSKMTFIKVAYVIEAKGEEDAMESLFDPAVLGMFSTESQREAHFTYVKENPNCSTELKIKVLEAFERKSWLSKISLNIQKQCSQSVKATFVMVKRILGAAIQLVLIPWQDSKDLVTIVSLQIFHHDVIQDRIDLIDNLPLREFIYILGIIYGVTFILKLMNASSTTSFSCGFNPFWIPFVREIVIAVQKMQETMNIYRKQLTVNHLVEKLEVKDDAGGSADVWSNILDLAQDIEEGKINLENMDKQRKQLKAVSILGDILQGSILILMLLRPDLRIRSFFNSVSMSGSLGINLKELGTLGNAHAHIHTLFTDSINLNDPPLI